MIDFIKHCEECSEIIPASRFKHSPAYKVRFCSKECQQFNSKRRMAEANNRPIEPVSTNHTITGSVSELVVSVDLMRKGYHVFRSMSPHSPCDLVVMKSGVVQRIEVRTGTVNLDGTYTYPKHELEKHQYDVLAVVIRGNEVIYTPGL